MYAYTKFICLLQKILKFTFLQIKFPKPSSTFSTRNQSLYGSYVVIERQLLISLASGASEV